MHDLLFCCNPFASLYLALIANQRPNLKWNVQKIELEEGRRLEAFCRSDADPSSLRLEVTRQSGRQRESAPLGLSFLSLGAVTKQDNGLEFICSSRDASDTLTLRVLSSSMHCFFFLFLLTQSHLLHQYSIDCFL